MTTKNPFVDIAALFKRQSKKTHTSLGKWMPILPSNIENHEKELRAYLAGESHVAHLSSYLGYLGNDYQMRFEQALLLQEGGLPWQQLAISARYNLSRILVASARLRAQEDAASPTGSTFALLLGVLLIADWKPAAHLLMQAIREGLDTRFVEWDARPFWDPHFKFFVLLAADALGLPLDRTRYDFGAKDRKEQELAVVTYEAVLADWRSSDLDQVRHLVGQMADFHVVSSAKDMMPFNGIWEYIFPYEILAFLRIREWAGLENPKSFAHPLMNTPLAVLPDAPLPWPEVPLLDAAIAKFKTQYPELHDFDRLAAGSIPPVHPAAQGATPPQNPVVDLAQVADIAALFRHQDQQARQWLAERAAKGRTLIEIHEKNIDYHLEYRGFVDLATRLELLGREHLFLFEHAALGADAPHWAPLAIGARCALSSALIADAGVRARKHGTDGPARGPQSVSFALTLSVVLIANWKPAAHVLMQVIREGLDTRFVDWSGNPWLDPRFKLLALLLADCQGQPLERARYDLGSKYATAAGTYEAVLADWRSPDAAVVQRLVKQMADLHVAGNAKIVWSFDGEGEFLFPYEILAFLRIREWAGLANPKSFAHPLMNTPLAALPDAPLPWPEVPLLDAVIAKFKTEYPRYNALDRLTAAL